MRGGQGWGRGRLLINGGGGGWPLCKLCTSAHTYWGWGNCHAEPVFFFIVFLSIQMFSWPVLSYFDYSFDLPSYGSDSTKRYTLRVLLICLEAREGSFGSYSAWAEMIYLWRLFGVTGGRMKRCKIYFGHRSPGFIFREIAWWINATLTLTISRQGFFDFINCGGDPWYLGNFKIRFLCSNFPIIWLCLEYFVNLRKFTGNIDRN